MRVERLDPVPPPSLCVDDTLGGYQDTEALGVYHPGVGEPYLLGFMRWVVAGGLRAPIGYNDIKWPRDGSTLFARDVLA